MQRRRLIQSAPVVERPWQYSGSESESETDSSDSSSVTSSTDTSQIHETPKRAILHNYNLVEEVPIASLRDDDTLLYRTYSSSERRKISFERDSPRIRYEVSPRSSRYEVSPRSSRYEVSPSRRYKKYERHSEIASWDQSREDRKIQSSSVFEAVRIGDVKRLQMVFAKYPHIVNSKNGMGNAPLHIAAQEGKIEIVKWLALKNAQLEIETPRGYTAMHLCALSGNVSCLRVLAAMGAKINCISSVDKKTPLHLAAMRGNIESVKWLVANGDMLYATDDKGETARILAEQCGHTYIAELLRTCEKEIENPRSVFTRMKSTSSVRSESTDGNVTKVYEDQPGKTYISECKIGSLIRDVEGTGLYQPIDIQLAVGFKHKIDSVTINLPSGKQQYPDVNDRNDGTISVIFQPLETGLHELNLHYTNGKAGGSIPFNVNAVNTSRIEAIGHGLRHTLINERSTFVIQAKDAYTGTPLNVKVDRDSPPPTPEPRQEPAPLPPPPKPIDRKSRCELSLNIPVHTSTARADIVFALDASASVGEKNFEKQLEFVAKIVDNHKIGPNHVQCSLITFATNVRNEFSLNKYHDKESLMEAIRKTEYHYGKTLTGEALRYIRKTSLSSSAGAREGCHKIVVVLTDGASTNKSVTLYEAGRLRQYNATVFAIGVGKKINREELEAIASDSKNVFRASSFHTLSSISKQIKLDKTETWSIRMTCVDQDNGPPSATFFVNYTNPFNMKASVTRPSGDREKCIVNKVNDYEYCIKFLPVEVGIHKVEVREENEPIPGSPFEFMIEPAKVVEEEPVIYEVKPVDPEPEQAPVMFEVEKKVTEPYEFKVYSREAYAGNLTVTVEGPSKATFNFDNRKSGIVSVSYIVTKPGEYLVSVKNDDNHIQESPFTVRVSKKCCYVNCDCKPIKC